MYARVCRMAAEPAGRGPIDTICRRCSHALLLSNFATPAAAACPSSVTGTGAGTAGETAGVAAGLAAAFGEFSQPSRAQHNTAHPSAVLMRGTSVGKYSAGSTRPPVLNGPGVGSLRHALRMRWPGY